MYLDLAQLERMRSGPGTAHQLECGMQGLYEVYGRGDTKETSNRNANAISENCYQPELNTCY
jgi:hypothetical protein